MSHNTNAKFAFWYLLSLVALIFMALGTGQVFFQVINKLIADIPGFYVGMFDTSVLKFAISSLIISIPLYFILTCKIERSLIAGDLDKESAIRRWLTYAILFISSVVMIFWLIYTINSFLGGDLTSKFLLKAVTVIIIAGLSFAYYFYESRREKINKKDPVLTAFFIVSLVITIAALVTAFFFVEKPAEARAKRVDVQILSNFSQLDGSINTYYSQNGKLPTALAQLNNDSGYLSADIFKDPETGKGFEYKVVDKNTYQLCADFRTSNKDENNRMPYEDFSWPHDAGYQCLKHQAISPIDAKMNAVPVK